MTIVLDQPRIQCRYSDEQDRQCPLDALENEECCKFHLPE